MPGLLFGNSEMGENDWVSAGRGWGEESIQQPGSRCGL